MSVIVAHLVQKLRSKKGVVLVTNRELNGPQRKWKELAAPWIPGRTMKLASEADGRASEAVGRAFFGVKEIGFRIKWAKMKLKLFKLRPKWAKLKFKQANLMG